MPSPKPKTVAPPPKKPEAPKPPAQQAAPAPAPRTASPPPAATASAAGPTPATSQALARVAPTAALASATSAPAWLVAKMQAGGKPKGMEVVTRNDLIMPRLALCQDGTPEVKDGKYKPGDIIDSVTRELVCAADEVLEFIPVLVGKARLHFRSMKQGGGILCRSLDSITAQPSGDGVDQGGQATRDCGACVRKEFRDDGDDTAPECTELINVLGFVPSRGYVPYVWSLKSTSLKLGRRFLTEMAQIGADLFAVVVLLGSTDDRRNDMRFKQWTYSKRAEDAGGPWVSEEEYARGLQLWKSMSGKKWEADTEDLAKGGEDASGEEQGPGAPEEFPDDPDAVEVPDSTVPPPAEAAARRAAAAQAQVTPPPPRTAAAQRPAGDDEPEF